MRRDIDIIRTIALAVESAQPGDVTAKAPGVDEDAFMAHAQWMADAGLIDARFHMSGAAILRLTWSGCDFLDAARNESLWAKAKDVFIKPSASWTFDIVKEWLKSEIQRGLPSLGA